MSSDIITTIARNEESKESLEEAKGKGISKEHWLSQKIIESTEHMEVNKAGEYLKSIDGCSPES